MTDLQPPLARVGERPFVGRERALAGLRDQLQAASRGERRLVLVTGEPGIGKTTLSAAFANEAREAGALVVYGRSDEQTLVPYQPFVDVISHLVLSGELDGAGDALDLELDELGRFAPELRRHAPASRGPALGLPETERYRLFEAMITTLGWVAGERTLVLVFDDLHWADPPSLLLLRHLARAGEPQRLLVVGTYRDVEVDSTAPLAELIADVRRELPLEQIGLEGLDERETEAMIQAHQGEPARPGLAARLRELTGGNPFFIEESLRSIEDAQGVPAGVREVVLRRVARLGPHATQVLSVAAVMGGGFAPGALPRVTDLSRDEVTDVLDRAVAARLLRGVDRAGRLSFAHALIRRTLHDELGGVVRAHLHERIAQTLESGRTELRPHAAELAFHFYQARHSLGPEPALRYARAAAEQAASALAWEEAAKQLERALELDELRDPPDPGDRCELLLELGVMRMRAGHPEFSKSFAEAAKLARGRSSTQFARAAIGYAGHYYEAGFVDRTLIRLLEDALGELGHAGNQDLRARVLARLAEIMHFAGETEASLDMSAKAVEIAVDLGDDEVMFHALLGRHVSLLHISQLEERLVVGDELVRRAHALHNPERTLQGLQARVFDLIESGQIDLARECADGLAEIAADLREPLFEHFAVGWAASFALMEGRLDDAERLVTGLDSVPNDFFWLTTAGLLAEASAQLCDPASAAVLYDSLAPYDGRMVQVGYAGSLGPVSRLLGRLAAARGDREAAVSHLESAVSAMEAAGLRLFETQARDELDELATASA